MKIVVSGYYGYGSNIDNVMLLSIIEDIKAVCESLEISVISKTPQNTKKDFGIKAIHKYNVFSILLAIFRTDLLVLGGGTLIQDTTSTKSLIYYLSLIRIAKILKKKVILYANGFSSLTSFKNSENARDVLNLADAITVRDSDSLKELENIGVTDPEIYLTADPAFLLEPDDHGNEILGHYGIPAEKKLLGVIVRKTKNIPCDFEEKMAAFCDYAADKYGLFPVFLPLEKRSDYSVSTLIKSKMKNRGVVVGTNYKVTSVLSIMKQMSVCLGTGIYTQIFSAIGNVPLIGLYEPKEIGLWNYMHGDENLVSLNDLNDELLKKYLDRILSDYETIKSNLKFNLRILRGKARDNRDLIKKLLYEKKV